MPLLLNSHNVFEYLVEHNLCSNSEQATSKVEPVVAKNFNLLVTFQFIRRTNRILSQKCRYSQCS